MARYEGNSAMGIEAQSLWRADPAVPVLESTVGSVLRDAAQRGRGADGGHRVGTATG